jgi:hypothetical protein
MNCLQRQNGYMSKRRWFRPVIPCTLAGAFVGPQLTHPLHTTDVEFIHAAIIGGIVGLVVGFALDRWASKPQS